MIFIKYYCIFQLSSYNYNRNTQNKNESIEIEYVNELLIGNNDN